MEKRVKEKVHNTVKLAIEIEKKLSVTVKDEELFKKIVTLSADLADIHESSKELIELIPHFVQIIESDKEKAADCLVEIETEMDHIVWHAKQSKKKIDLLADILYREDDEKNENN